jgi:hypothetical protein
MGIVNNFRRKLGEYFLKKQLADSQRESFFYSFENASSIGIVFNATDEEEFALVKKYVKYLRGLNKKVKTIGFFETKEVPDMAYSKIEYDFFTNKDLNWYLKPDKHFVENFIQEEFDILIDLNMKDDFPLHYISCLSRARFKIGRFADASDLYDLMFEMGEERGSRVFLKHLDHYIMQFNNHQSKNIVGA